MTPALNAQKASDLETARRRPYVRYVLKSSQLRGFSKELEETIASQATEMVIPATIPESPRFRAR